jgi:hypothetical protein
MSELGPKFVVPKLTGTHGDVFAAVGLADLLRQHPDLRPIRLREQPASFEVQLPKALAETDIWRLPHSPGYRYLKTSEKISAPPEAVDYKSERERADQFRQLHNATRGKVIDAETAARLQELRPPAEWRLWQTLNVLQGDQTSNRVYWAISDMPQADFYRQLWIELSNLGHVHQSVAAWKASSVQLAGDLFRSGPAVGQSVAAWKASSVQLFTPNAAKGYSRLKPDSTDRNDKTKDQWIEPFLEWLRYRGYFLAALPYFQGAKGENVRLLCPVPGDISIDAFRRVVGDLRRAQVYGRSAKVDCLAVLNLAGLLIRNSQEFGAPDDEPYAGLDLAGRTPADILSGVTTTHYQSMGNSKAVAAMSVVALPAWFPIFSKQDAEDWLDILEEHRRVLLGLQDDHSDEIGLLIAYRRFLEQRSETSYWCLVEFMEQYGPFFLRARESGRRVRAFTTTTFRRLTQSMAKPLMEILQDDGFQAVAEAVRRATVNAQALKAMNQDYREIRYDLLPDLRRTRSVPGSQFIETISEFISRYNVENARRREMNKPAPANVTTDDFMRFMRLVEKHGSAVVGALLCAYGSCREPREPEARILGESDQTTPDEIQEG